MDRYIVRSKVKTSKDQTEPQPSTSKEPESHQIENVNHQMESIGQSESLESDVDKVESIIDNNVDSDEEESNSEPQIAQKKRKHYDVNYRQNWEYAFSWLKKKSDLPYCVNCDKSLKGGKKHLTRHADTELHKKNTRKKLGIRNIETAMAAIPKVRFDKQIKVAEMKLVMFAAEHNSSFLIFEHLPQFLASLPDKEIMKQVKCSQTKATQLITDKIGPFAQIAIANVLKETFFSVIIDETTDIATCKCLVIIVRYYDKIEMQVSEKFFGLIELESATADSIFQALLTIFRNSNIPLTNIIGFASDNASVMMGHLNGVKAKFQEILPHIFSIGCLSHSLHLCASKACACLPNEIENLARNIFNYFSHSAKRKHDFKEFQAFVELEPHKMLRPSQTRWLSLQAVVSRILQQWNALTLYFQSEHLVENVYGATEILNNLNDVVFKLYFNFLNHILKIITKMNIEFQSEKPRIHVLIPTISSYYKMISKFLIKNDIVNTIPVHVIDPRNPHHFKPLENVYFGAEFESILNIHIQQLYPQHLHQIRINCLNFYIELCAEIKKRINFQDEILNGIANSLDLNNIFNDGKPSIVTLAKKFPNIINDESLEDLNLEWRLLSDYKPVQDILNIDELIEFMSKQKNPLGINIFKNVLNLIQTIISLPHGSAGAERIFSQLAIIKNKYRNMLNVSTVEKLLFSKGLLKGNHCFNWEPEESLLVFKKN